MTRDEHNAQRDRVSASLVADDGRESHHGTYAVRTAQKQREAAQKAQDERAPMRRVERWSGRWT